jgi:hypothetical protein
VSDFRLYPILGPGESITITDGGPEVVTTEERIAELEAAVSMLIWGLRRTGWEIDESWDPLSRKVVEKTPQAVDSTSTR